MATNMPAYVKKAAESSAPVKTRKIGARATPISTEKRIKRKAAVIVLIFRIYYESPKTMPRSAIKRTRLNPGLQRSGLGAPARMAGRVEIMYLDRMKAVMPESTSPAPIQL